MSTDVEELEWICKVEREMRMIRESRAQLDRRLQEDRARLDQRLQEIQERQREERIQREENERTRLEQNLNEYREQEERRLEYDRAHLEQSLSEMDSETRARLEQTLREELAENERTTVESLESHIRSSRERLQREQRERMLMEEQDRARMAQRFVEELEQQDRPARQTLEQLERKIREARELPRWAIPEQHFFLDNSNCRPSSPNSPSSPTTSPSPNLIQSMRNALNRAFDNFYRNNVDKLTEQELIRVYTALAMVVGRDNPGLMIAYFEYYSSHNLRRYNSREMNNNIYRNLDAITYGHGDTAINTERVNLISIGLIELGALLLHEAMHTRDPATGFLRDYLEGSHYAFEYILGLRTQNMTLQDYAIRAFRNPSGITTNPQAFYRIARISYEIFRILYDVIDHDTSSQWSAQFSGLNNNRARDLLVEYIFGDPENRSRQLQDITMWVEIDVDSSRPAYPLRY